MITLINSFHGTTAKVRAVGTAEDYWIDLSYAAYQLHDRAAMRQVQRLRDKLCGSRECKCPLVDIIL